MKTAHGERWHAYSAGPCHWYECHTKGRTKPCLHEITGGAMKCPRCSPLDLATTIGYQPLFRELDTRPCFVVVHDSVREAVDALTHFRRVVVGRGEDQSDGVFVTAALNPEPRFVTAVPWKLRPTDLTPSLLKVWALPDLREWYAANHSASDTALSLRPGVAVKDDGTPYAPIMQGAAKRFGADVIDTPDANELFAASVKSLTEKASANGKHAKPKG